MAHNSRWEHPFSLDDLLAQSRRILSADGRKAALRGAAKNYHFCP